MEYKHPKGKERVFEPRRPGISDGISRQVVRAELREKSFAQMPSHDGHGRSIPRARQRAMGRVAGNRKFRAERGLADPGLGRRGGVRK